MKESALCSLVILMAVAVVSSLVVGLLRTHAEVLRRLRARRRHLRRGRHLAPRPRGRSARGPPTAAEPTIRADLRHVVRGGPARRRLDSLPADLVGVDARGDAVHVGVAGNGRLTLLAFLSSGCTTCAGFWDAFHEGRALVLDGGARPRIVVVTKSPEHEHVGAVATRPPAGGTVVMSSDAWTDYRVPASPYFVLVDGMHGVIGEGSAASFAQLAGLLDRATTDLGVAPQAAPSAAQRVEDRIDLDLLRAGITPGHSSLYDWTSPESDADATRAAALVAAPPAALRSLWSPVSRCFPASTRSGSGADPR
jgi:hypothetical protein